MLIRVQSALQRGIHSVLTGGRMTFGSGSVLLRPQLIQVTGSGRIELGPGAVIDRNARIVVRDAVLRIGAGAYIGHSSTIVAYADVTIGDRALVGERVSIHSEDHGPVWNRDLFCVSPVEVGIDSWICAGAVLSKGSRVGTRTTVAANSFVRGELPPDVLAAGAPAQVVRTLPATRRSSARPEPKHHLEPL